MEFIATHTRPQSESWVGLFLQLCLLKVDELGRKDITEGRSACNIITLRKQ